MIYTVSIKSWWGFKTIYYIHYFIYRPIYIYKTIYWYTCNYKQTFQIHTEEETKSKPLREFLQMKTRFHEWRGMVVTITTRNSCAHISSFLHATETIWIILQRSMSFFSLGRYYRSLKLHHDFTDTLKPIYFTMELKTVTYDIIFVFWLFKFYRIQMTQYVNYVYKKHFIYKKINEIKCASVPFIYQDYSNNSPTLIHGP